MAPKTKDEYDTMTVEQLKEAIAKATAKLTETTIKNVEKYKTELKTKFKECEDLVKLIKEGDKYFFAPWSIQYKRVDMNVLNVIERDGAQSEAELIAKLPHITNDTAGKKKVTDFLEEAVKGTDAVLVLANGKYSLTGKKLKREATPAAS